MMKSNDELRDEYNDMTDAERALATVSGDVWEGLELDGSTARVRGTDSPIKSIDGREGVGVFELDLALREPTDDEYKSDCAERGIEPGSQEAMGRDVKRMVFRGTGHAKHFGYSTIDCERLDPNEAETIINGGEWAEFYGGDLFNIDVNHPDTDLRYEFVFRPVTFEEN